MTDAALPVNPDARLIDVRHPDIDYTFRPASYWRNDDDELTELLKNIKGTNRRRMIRDFFDAGHIAELEPVLRQESLSDDQRRSLGRIHPSFMGGEYLPDYLAAEVEIARIGFASTLADVISIRARRGIGPRARVRYRIVDEYEGGFIWHPRTTRRPLTLEGLVRFIDTAEQGESIWAVGLGLAANVAHRDAESCDASELRHFITVTSEFYPQLYVHYDRLHTAWVARETPVGLEEAECH